MLKNSRHAPDLDRECPDLDVGVDVLEGALRRRHHPTLRALSRSGPHAGVIIVVLGDDSRAHELFVFARATDGAEASAACVDVIDAILKEAVTDDDAYLPLDWEGRPYDGGVVFVRGEVRNYVAEHEAAKLLGEDMPPRAIP